MTVIPGAQPTQQSGTLPMGVFPYKVWIDPEALLKLNLYAAAALDYAQSEIGGLAKINIVHDQKNIFVEDVYMFEQEASGAYFTFTADAMNKFTLDMIKAGKQDEIQHWSSIVHSHPVGMGPSMSGVDITMLENYAEDQQAFSLIITASKQADSKRLLMHYCTTVDICGEKKKYVIKDIPVLTALSGQQVRMIDTLSESIYAEMGDLTETDKTKTRQMVQEFVHTKLPVLVDSQQEEMREKIFAEVPTLITKRYQKATNSPPGSAPKAGGNTSSLITKTSQAGMKNLPGIGMSGNGPHDQRKMLETIERLRSIWCDGVDPNNKDLHISKRMRKRSRQLWLKAMLKINGFLREENGVGIWDTVEINESAKGHATYKGKTFEVAHYEPGDLGSYVVVNEEGAGEMFWPHELDVIETFEEWWEGLTYEQIELLKTTPNDDVRVAPDTSEAVVTSSTYDSHWRIEEPSGLVRFVLKKPGETEPPKLGSGKGELVPIGGKT